MIRSLTTMALTLAAAASVPTIASARDRDDYRYHDRGERRVIVRDRYYESRDFDVDVSLRDVPREVWETVNFERQGRRIESVQYVRRDGKLFYRFRIDDKGRHGRDDDFNIRVAPGGRLLSIADAEPNFVHGGWHR